MCIEGQALVVMDVHAHLSHAEVTGLLGGLLDHTCDGDKLCVTMAVPCDSLSTSLQCEMDPGVLANVEMGSHMAGANCHQL